MKYLNVLKKDYILRWGDGAVPPKNLLKNIIKNKKNLNVLEIGCSRGYNLNFLNKNEFTHVYGIDMDPISINKAKEQYLSINFEICDITKIPNLVNVFNTKFDIIFSKSCLQHITSEDIVPTIHKIYNALTDSGVCYLCETGFEDDSWRNQGVDEHSGIALDSGVYSHNYSEVLKMCPFKNIEKLEFGLYFLEK